MARKTKVITVTLKVEVDLDQYAAEYGLPREDAAADAAEHVPYVVTGAAEAALERLGYAKVKTREPVCAGRERPCSLPSGHVGQHVDRSAPWLD